MVFETVALIPARGGSKRLPRKNLRLFAGQPLIYFSIALAQAIDRIDFCVVSTEDPEIAAVARSYGVEVIERPPELADDVASTESVAIHTLQTLAATGRMPEVILLLQPNCPLRPRGLVIRALELLEEGVSDSVVSVTPHHQKTGSIKDDLFVPEYVPGTRSQDMLARYFENGLVYATWTRRLMASGSLFGVRVQPLVTDPLYALGDIDTALDFEITEFLFEKYRSHFDWATPQLPLPCLSHGQVD